MEKEEFINEINYQMTKNILKDMFRKKLICEKEYKEYLKEMKKKYAPTFDILTD